VLFASVLIHELGHSLVAKARGLPVTGITLFIFGGVSNLGEEAAEAKDEFLVAIVGPLTSFFLAAAFRAARAGLATGDSPPAAVFEYLAYANVALGAFNLLPGFPLDGGRVLRSIIWATTGSMRRATQIASYAGQGMAFLLVFVGISQVFAGAFLNGMWLTFIGWFLNNAAEATRQAQVARERLGGLRVAEMMDAEPAVASPDLSVQEFVYWHALRHGHRALPVVADGRLVGLVSVTDAKELPQPDWQATPVSQIMARLPLKTVTPETDVSAALRLLVDGSVNQLPVVRGDSLVGMVCRADILQALRLADELDVESLSSRARAPARSSVARAA
jgi:Zn-dependent protease/predicted transcriptional regulator